MPTRTPRVAAGQTGQREIRARCRAMRLQRLQRIGGTGWLKTAGRPKPRAQEQTVGLNQPHQCGLHHGLATTPEVRARANSCCNSLRTAALRASDVALGNWARSNPERKRTKCARGSKP
eukprot:gene28071-49860_t